MRPSVKDYDRLPIDSKPHSNNETYVLEKIRGIDGPQKITAIVLLTVLLSGSIGFVVGFYCASYPRRTGLDALLAPDGTVKHTMIYNRTFSQAPSNETNAAWQSIFPRGRGFVQHPIYSPNISGYYAAISNSTSTTTHHHNRSIPLTSISPTPTPLSKSPGVGHMHDDPGHMRHCFDYLRQSLMCAADTNIEPVDWKLRGITGWRNERTCRDYESVVTWAERWRTHNETGHA